MRSWFFVYHVCSPTSQRAFFVAEIQIALWYNVIIENSNKEVAKMTHKQEVKLNRLQMKLEIELKIIQTLLNECGDWHDGTGKDKLVLRVFNEMDVEEATVHFINNKFVMKVSGWKIKFNIDDNTLTFGLKEGMKKAKAQKKIYKVWFQVMGRYTDSNNIGYAKIEAESKEQAMEFAREELTKGMFKKVEVDCRGICEDCGQSDGMDNYAVDWSATGKYGKYYAQGGPYAKNEKDAERKQKQDLTLKDGFMGFEDELSVDDE